jgi:beta-galactosidase
VIDEADIETHGCYALVNKPDLISHDKRWEGRFIDRVKAMYMRDKNRASIIMWSLGNESGGYNNHDSAYAYLKEVCPEIPVHYEGVSRTARFRYDVVSEMYPSYDRIKKLGGKPPKKYRGAPYFICEYCHAMGVGPGGLKEMTDLFFSAGIYLGGCIWEWADHAVYNKNGPYKYTYGGDHGEEIHDGNFCADGLVYPDRRPHTGLENVKVNYSPFNIKKIDVNVFELTNRNFFRGSDYMSVKYTVEKNGEAVSNGNLELDAAPSSACRFEIYCGEPPRAAKKSKHVAVPDADIYVTFEYIDKKSRESIAKQQLCIARKPFVAGAESSAAGAAEIKETDGAFVISYADGGGSVVISKYSGNIEQITRGKTDYLSKNPKDGIVGIYDGIYRAPIDNDRNIKDGMIKANYDVIAPYVKKIGISEKLSVCGRKVISVEKRLVNLKGKTLFKLNVNYGVTAGGSIWVETKFKKASRKLPLLLRIGYSLELPSEFGNIKYYGRGPSENLPDFNEHAYIGAYRQKVADMNEPYIKPQDNCYHTDVRRIEALNNDGNGLAFEAVDKPLGFSAHDYSQKALAAAAHQEDLTSSGTTFINVDGFTAGAGSNSCGPLPPEKFLLRPNKKYAYIFVIKTL